MQTFTFLLEKSFSMLNKEQDKNPPLLPSKGKISAWKMLPNNEEKECLGARIKHSIYRIPAILNMVHTRYNVKN